MNELKNKIKSYLFSTNLRWSELHERSKGAHYFTPTMKEEYEEVQDKLLDLIEEEKKTTREITIEQCRTNNWTIGEPKNE